MVWPEVCVGVAAVPTQGLQKVKTYIYKYSYIYLQQNSKEEKSNNKPQKNCFNVLKLLFTVCWVSHPAVVCSHTPRANKIISEANGR